MVSVSSSIVHGCAARPVLAERLQCYHHRLHLQDVYPAQPLLRRPNALRLATVPPPSAGQPAQVAVMMCIVGRPAGAIGAAGPAQPHLEAQVRQPRLAVASS